MKVDQLTEDLSFLRRRQHWLEGRIREGGMKSYDVKEAEALGRVLSLLEKAVQKVEEGAK